MKTDELGHNTTTSIDVDVTETNARTSMMSKIRSAVSKTWVIKKDCWERTENFRTNAVRYVVVKKTKETNKTMDGSVQR
jgi:hypothetical protein